MRRILKFVRLPSTEQRVLVKSAFLLVAVRLGLLIFPFRALLNLLERAKSESREESNVSGMTSDRIAWAVVVTSRYIPFTKCLTQALVAQILFAQYGYAAHLRIGVSKNENEQLEAHAWVECKGQVVIGNCPDFTRYKVMPSLEEKKI